MRTVCFVLACLVVVVGAWREAGAQQGVSLTSDDALLAAPADWQRIGAVDARRVTPRWAPDGATIATRGWGGVGLFVSSPDGSADRAADRAYVGPFEWHANGLCLARPDGRDQVLRLDGADDHTTCQLAPVVPELGIELFSDGQRAVYFHAFEGTVTLTSPSGERRLFEGEPLSQVAASPDGRLLAISRGALADPSLQVVDLADPSARPLELGKGAQPAWSPDGRYLAFVVPVGQHVADGHAGFVQSELFVYDTSSGALEALTQTSDRVEMEPAFSPDGTALAFADWQSGAVFVAAFGRRSRP